MNRFLLGQFSRFAPAIAVCGVLVCGAVAGGAGPDDQGYADLDSPAHEYWTRTLRDPFSRIRGDLEAGRLPLDFSSDKAAMSSLLEHLGVPVSSQMLVFSTTSLQLRKISPRNPRALYFNEELYVGWVPGGQVEVISLDPEAGGIFYIFDVPRQGRAPVVERSRRCMNCHADDETRQAPGLVIRSVIPGPRGGTLDSYREEQNGHQIPFEDRFGGWHLTGNPGIAKHWGNRIGRLDRGKLSTFPVRPGEHFDWSTYPVATSDILPQLLHEHQAGFVNRVLEASYRARTYLHEGKGRLDRVQVEILGEQAKQLTRYLLFADEAPLPKDGLRVDPIYREAFQKNRKTAAGGLSLKDFDLEERGIFRHRCSYMIYSGVFQGLPTLFKQQVYRTIGAALDPEKPAPDYAYLPDAEKAAIRRILRETLADLPEGW